MKVNELFNFLKLTKFKYYAIGLDGGKGSMHSTELKNFGYCGRERSYPQTFIFKIQKEYEGITETTEKEYSNLNEIEPRVLEMQIVSVEKMRLFGNNISSANHFNDSSNLTLIVKEHSY